MRSDKAARNHHSGQCSPSRSTRSPSHPRHAHVHDVNPQVRVGKNTFTFGKAPLPPGVQRAAEQLRDDLEQAAREVIEQQAADVPHPDLALWA